jgi:hypothetical protein
MGAGCRVLKLLLVQSWDKVLFLHLDVSASCHITCKQVPISELRALPHVPAPVIFPWRLIAMEYKDSRCLEVALQVMLTFLCSKVLPLSIQPTRGP